jgi:hypothetical protein
MLDKLVLIKLDDEIRRITNYEEWCNLADASDLEGSEVEFGCGTLKGLSGTIIVRPTA